MDFKSSIPENLEALFGKLESFLKTETVVGEPIVVGSTTLVPIVTVTFGGGTGGGVGKDPKGADGSGGGAGIGARITPNAILVIKNDEVSMLPVKGRNNLENLVEMVPEIISKIDLKKYCKKDKNTEEKSESAE
ncbi:MAG: GerW family sporulation protein [Clostridiaceae bacterium]